MHLHNIHAGCSNLMMVDFFGLYCVCVRAVLYGSRNSIGPAINLFIYLQYIFKWNISTHVYMLYMHYSRVPLLSTIQWDDRKMLFGWFMWRCSYFIGREEHFTKVYPTGIFVLCFILWWHCFFFVTFNSCSLFEKQIHSNMAEYMDVPTYTYTRTHKTKITIT